MHGLAPEDGGKSHANSLTDMSNAFSCTKRETMEASEQMFKGGPWMVRSLRNGVVFLERHDGEFTLMVKTWIAPHRARFATLHTQYVHACGSRLSPRLNVKRIVSLEVIVCHSRAPRLTLIRHGLTFHFFHFLSASLLYIYQLTVMNNHQIHAQQDGLVDGPCKGCSQAGDLGASHRVRNRSSIQ